MTLGYPFRCGEGKGFLAKRFCREKQEFAGEMGWEKYGVVLNVELEPWNDNMLIREDLG